MSNKKRIQKLIQAKYKAPRKVVTFDHYKFGIELGIASENYLAQLKLINDAFYRIFSMMSDIMRVKNFSYISEVRPIIPIADDRYRVIN